MGNWFSSNPNKNIASEGQVNNNVIMENGLVSYDLEMLVLTSIICGIKIFEFVIFVYKHHSKYIKENHARKLQQNVNFNKV